MQAYLSRGLLHAAFYCRHVNIARLLISHKADAENINDDNVAPLFHLFQPGPRNKSAAARELLDIALPYSVSNINVQSCEGWTALHRAAAHGTGKDIDTLLEHGANIGLRTKEFQWVPIAAAVHFGNIATFERLMHYTGVSAVRDIDSRGRTMLHLAAEQGYSKLVTLLVSSGADLHAESEPDPNVTLKDKPSRRLTPLDVAREAGPEMLHNYVFGLQSAKVDVQVDCGDVFWPVEE
jgi:ankyrin repeat protein